MPEKRLIAIVWSIVLLGALAACRPAAEGDGEALAQADAEKQAQKEAQPMPESSEPRVRLTSGVVEGTARRVEAAADATPGPRLATYLISPGAEKPLSPELLEELLRLVREDSGFDASVVKRCQSGTSVGFSLVRESGQPKTEMVVDFGCDRLMIGEAGAAAADLHVTYFDPSHDAFVDFVKRVLPDDKEVGQLR